MTALRKIFKKNIATVGGKRKVVDKLNRQDEDAEKRRKEEGGLELPPKIYQKKGRILIDGR